MESQAESTQWQPEGAGPARLPSTPVFENDRIRVVKVRVQPGQPTQMHSHPAYFTYYLNDAKVRFTYPDGRSEVVDLHEGGSIWSDGETHQVENVGNDVSDVLVVELK